MPNSYFTFTKINLKKLQGFFFPSFFPSSYYLICVYVKYCFSFFLNSINNCNSHVFIRVVSSNNDVYNILVYI
uniref:Uncharacterized protein n=1 Tax=Lepeophtheirus salmonis TaxID=72036 RepID=A0A0K2UMV6_LEPSM